MMIHVKIDKPFPLLSIKDIFNTKQLKILLKS